MTPQIHLDPAKNEVKYSWTLVKSQRAFSPTPTMLQTEGHL